ncbi:2-oxo-4-hydroxy-4-carboxy-5-ureidoimidazoline decarboxylase [Streptomyces sp. NPDC004726]
MTSRPQRLPGGRPEPSGGLGRFNATPETEALIALHEVCASAAWGRGVLAHRPYATAEAVLAASDAALARLTDAELTEAMAGHPPIGRPGLGDPVSSREQSGMTRAPDALKEEMRELNLVYQDRFGHVFLICATGLTGDELRDALKARLGNTPRRERETARTELGRINRIRLTRLLDGPYPQRNK